MKIVIALCLFLLFGCATAHKINKISIGMSKGQVIETLGDPVSVTAKDGIEYLNYRYSETGDDAFYGRTDPYVVVIKNGVVDGYGREREFTSFKPQTIRIQREDITTEKKD